MKIFRALVAASLAFVLSVEPVTASGTIRSDIVSIRNLGPVQDCPLQIPFDRQALSLPPDFADPHPTSEHALQERAYVGAVEISGEQLAEDDFIRADNRSRGSGKIETVTFRSWVGLSSETQERLLKQAISRHETVDLLRSIALLAPLQQGKPLRIAFVPREFKADPRRPLKTLIDMFRWQRLIKNAQLTSFFLSWDSPEDIQSHVWSVPGREDEKVSASINLRRSARLGGGQPAKDCTLCNNVIQTKYPNELWMRLGNLNFYFNPYPSDAPKEHSFVYDQPLRAVAVWAGPNAAGGHISQSEIYQVPYLREFRMQWMRLNGSFFLAWFKKFRIEINGWGYGKEGNHGGATQDHVHAHFSRKSFMSENRPVQWEAQEMPGHPGVHIGLVPLLPGETPEGRDDHVVLALEAQGSSLAALDEAVSEALKTISEEKDSFDVLYFEARPAGAREWLGWFLRKIGLGPWLSQSLGPRVRILLTGRINAAPKNGPPLGAYQVVGLENIIEGNPLRYYRLSSAQRTEYEAIPIQNIDEKITLINRWLKEGAIVRLSDQELYENFRSELRQTAYSRAQIEKLAMKLLGAIHGSRPSQYGLSRSG
jgi:hypothetical protein